MSDTNEFYVYLHRRASDNKVFYVGKGKGKRAWAKRGRNDRWNKTYNKHGLIVEIAFDNLTEEEAFELEKQTVLEMRHCYGNTNCNLTDGGEGASGAKASEYTRELIGRASRARAASLADRNMDKTIYKFLKLDTKEVIECNRIELGKLFNINHQRLRPLFITNNPKNKALGFAILKENETVEECIARCSVKKKPSKPHKILSANRYNNVYCFVSADGTAIWATLDNMGK